MNDNRIHFLNNQYTVVDDPFFGRCRQPIELDMGCGSGSFSLELAKRFPQRLVLAGDIMLGRLRRLEKRVGENGLRNIEILRAANQELAAYQLPDSCLRRVHILCPDPWPKERHRARRLMSSDFLVRIARILEPGGIMHFSTDDQDYLELMTANANAFPFIVEDRQGTAIADVCDIPTDFEKQWREAGRTVPHLAFRVDKPSYRPC